MSLLMLHIDTATEFASICLTRDETVLGMRICHDQNQHGAFLQPAIEHLMLDYGLALSNLDAISVAEGPGSYTGLRVTMASAKGLCYALNKPLISINTLKIMALAAVEQEGQAYPNAIYCPLIDARRMEVFTAVYSSQLVPIIAPEARIIDKDSFSDFLDDQVIIFTGSGAPKLQAIIDHPNAVFSNVQHSARQLASLASMAYAKQAFANLAYCEPFYLKAFYSVPAKK
jgi:tRNA threonylcarbamoyladenosine biosynthesis protein TsaB